MFTGDTDNRDTVLYNFIMESDRRLQFSHGIYIQQFGSSGVFNAVRFIPASLQYDYEHHDTRSLCLQFNTRQWDYNNYPGGQYD